MSENFLYLLGEAEPTDCANEGPLFCVGANVRIVVAFSSAHESTFFTFYQRSGFFVAANVRFVQSRLVSSEI